MLLIATVLAACTNYTSIPPSSYAEVNPAPRHGYRIVTHSGIEYIAKRVTVRGDSLQIEEVKDPAPQPVSLPVSIAFSEIDHVDLIQINYASPIVLGACVVAAIAALGHLLNSIPAMD